MSGLALLIGIWSIIMTILWLVIGWRAMTAHERIAAAVERIAQKDSLPRS